MTRSIEPRKIKQNGLNKRQQQELSIYFIVYSVATFELYFRKDVHFIWKKTDTEKPALWPFVQ